MSVVGNEELASCLRTWRDRLTPAEVGLPAGVKRRAPGLRREEIAALAGLSVDYLARLEQGRASSPSASVLGALARALRITDAERAHLFRVAGLAEPGSRRMNRHLTPGVQRVLDRLGDVPVTVIDPSWTVVAMNPLAQALTGDASEVPESAGEPGGRSGDGRDVPEALSNRARARRDALGRNYAVQLFEGTPTLVDRTPEEWERTKIEVVADLHGAVSRYPDDEDLRAVVDYLRAENEAFATLWDQRPVAERGPDRKSFNHPEVGRITVDCDVLTVQASDLRLIVYTVAPGSPDADALALLAAIGLQTF